MVEGCRNSVAYFRTISIDMIEIYKAITQFVKYDFKKPPEECRLYLKNEE